jgi:hypothetical protein
MSEQRNIKRIPIAMDLLFEESVTPEDVNSILVRLSEAVSNSKHGLSLKGNTLKEARFMVVGRILVTEDFIEKKKSIQEF